MFGRNPRILDLRVRGSVSSGVVVSMRAHARSLVAKIQLADRLPSSSLSLEREAISLLARWLARRYTRPAWPDEFNRRLDQQRKRLDALFKSQSSKGITGIWIALDPLDDELTQAAPYRMVIWLTVREEDRMNVTASRVALAFEQKLAATLKDCPGLVLATPIEIRSEADFTLADQRLFRRLDRDYRSLAPDPGGDLAPDET
jgi:hypothetical protein